MGMSLSFVLAHFYFFHFYSALFLVFALYAITKKHTLLLSFMIGVFYLSYHQTPQNPPQIIEGISYIKIQKQKSSYKKSTYFGTLHGAYAKGTYYPLFHSVSFRLQESNLQNGDYIFKGRLVLKNDRFYLLQNPQIVQFIRISSSDQTKHRIQAALQKLKIKDHSFVDGENFLYGCLFGLDVQKELKTLFSKLGLSHILAISGFHFSLISLFLHRLFSKLLPRNLFFPFMLLMISLYAILVGSSSSIIRAYTAIVCSLIGTVFEKKTIALNFLFIGMIVLFCFYPFSYLEIGFQLSFLATFGLLSLYPPIISLFNQIFPVRSYQEACQFDHINQIGYILLQIIKKIVAINLSALIPTFFLLLYFFKTISSLSFIYNLFIPFIVGLLMTVGLFSLCIKILFSIEFPYRFVMAFSQQLLDYLSYYPRKFDFTLSIENLSLFPLIFIESLIVLSGILFYIQEKNRRTRRFT